MIGDDFLRILRCPLTHQPLTLAGADLLERVNAAVDAGGIVNRLGETVTRRLDGGLVNQQGTLLYAIHDDIPCLLTDEAIDLGQPGLSAPSDV